MTTAAPTAPEPQAQDATPVERLFRYSAWIHTGPGAQNCEDISEDFAAPKNECTNPLHFHAWVRLPNQWQHDSIREKALAAKGRRARVLRDPGTDAHDALEEAMDAYAQVGESAREEIIEELLDKDRWRDYSEAVRDVMDIDADAPAEDGETPKLFQHIAEDQRRYDELLLRAEDDPDVRESDELKELTAHLARYAEAVKEAHEKVVAPKREALNALDINSLIDQLREDRIRREVSSHFMSVYSRWEWFMCTYTRPSGERRFATLEQMEDVAPEVWEALRETFDNLEQSQNMGVESGNS